MPFRGTGAEIAAHQGVLQQARQARSQEQLARDKMANEMEALNRQLEMQKQKSEQDRQAQAFHQTGLERLEGMRLQGAQAIEGQKTYNQQYEDYRKQHDYEQAKARSRAEGLRIKTETGDRPGTAQEQQDAVARDMAKWRTETGMEPPVQPAPLFGNAPSTTPTLRTVIQPDATTRQEPISAQPSTQAPLQAVVPGAPGVVAAGERPNPIVSKTPSGPDTTGLRFTP